jgi:hypothetical protein
MRRRVLRWKAWCGECLSLVYADGRFVGAARFRNDQTCRIDDKIKRRPQAAFISWLLTGSSEHFHAVYVDGIAGDFAGDRDVVPFMSL